MAFKTTILLHVSFCVLNLMIKSAMFLDECSIKPIVINGVTSTAAMSIVNAISNQYSMERAKYDRNVTLNVTVLTDVTLLKYGLTAQVVPTEQPIVFSITVNSVKVNGNDLRIPMAASALVIIYNLPGVQRVTLSIPNIVYIYNGRLDNWNSAYISLNNENVTLPNATIQPIARMEADASTGLFTQVLSANNAEWNSTYGVIFDPTFVNGVCCNSTVWPNNTIAWYASKTVGMVGMVVSIPYTIGYVTLPSINEYGSVPRARLIKSKKQPHEVYPNKYSVQQAIKYFVDNSNPNDLSMKIELPNITDAYPMSAFSYFVFNKSYTKVDCCIVQELVGFLDWYLFEWADEHLEDLSYVPLTDELKLKIKRLVLEQVTCNGDAMYPKYLLSKIVHPPKTTLAPWAAALVSVVVCVALASGGYAAFYCLYVRKLETGEKRWLIDEKLGKRFQMKKRPEMDGTSQKETISIHSENLPGYGRTIVDSTSLTNGSVSTRFNNRNVVSSLKELMDVGELFEMKIFLDFLECRFPQHWTKSTKRLVYKMKNLTDKNIASLIGVIVVNNSTYTLFEYCSKGTLHYVLQTSKYNITEDIKYQFAIDVAQGAKYLHQNHVITGRLNSLSCYLDSSWTVKLTQYEQMSVYLIENPKLVLEFGTFYSDKYLEEKDLIELLYVDPTIRQSFTENVDVYSFGILLVEIFSRKLPYSTEIEDGTTSYNEILTKKFYRNLNVRPGMNRFPKKVQSLINECTTLENHRPNFQRIYNELKNMTKISTGIVDIIMNALEQHAEKLEEKVEERTVELRQITAKMRLLLHEVLPPQIADKLFAGEPVPPEYFECVTVYFSDIVGFTTISAKSKPMEVMAFLNDLWVAFDEVIEKFDVYKVDTIGDAYMVCSGLPIRNGTKHCKNIALLALALLEKCSKFEIKHLPNEKLKVRIGVNSGPVTAGVVGSKMPQYCVFGDTVNTATIMESTSESQKIQLSSITYELLIKNFPRLFDMKFRGETDVMRSQCCAF